MTIVQLCEKIQIPQPVQARLNDLISSMDFCAVESLLPSFYDREKMRSVHEQLQQVLGEDPGNMKMLACMLYASAAVFDVYQARGIGEPVYYDTMKCYARFLQETYTWTGRWEFDRYWWTGRQAGGHLFRIGQLEYEIKKDEDRDVIGIHIPSDAVFSPDAVDASLTAAKQFFERYFPELSGCDYICHSWLLDGQLREFLPGGSNIVSFQNRFTIYKQGEASDEFIEWLFHTRSRNIADLPEEKNFQKMVKYHILKGGRIFNSYGRLLQFPE